MVPYELLIRNFMCYRDNLEPLRLDGMHVACLSGENGAGKSALLDAMTWALWGKARMSDDELIAQGASEMLVELTFHLNGQDYRVTRRRQRGKTSKSGKVGPGKSTLEFQARGDNGWRVLGEHNLSETQRTIERVLRMKYDTFINASFLLQGRADEFTRKTSGERKQVLSEILDLREYDALEKRARERARKLKEQVLVLDGNIELLEKEAEKRDQYAEFVSKAETVVEESTRELEAAETARRAADEQVRALETRQQRLDEVRARLRSLRDEQQQQQQEVARLHEEIARDEAILLRRDEIMAGVAALAEAQAELARYDDLRPRYDDLREQRQHLQDQLKDERHTLQIELKRQQDEAERLRQQSARQSEVQAELHHLEQQIAVLAPLSATLDDLRQQRSVHDERSSRISELVLRHHNLSATIARRRESLTAEREEHRRSIAQHERQLRDADRIQRDLKHALAQQQELDAAEARLATLREQERATTSEAATLRAHCEQFHQQAEQIKQRKELLHDDSATTCPLCGSNLGEHGVSTIVEHYDEEIEALRADYRRSKQRADALDADLGRLREQTSQSEARVTQMQQDVARIEPLRQQATQAEEARAALEQTRAALATIEQQLAADDYEHETRASLQTVEADLTALIHDLPRPEPASGSADWTFATAQLERQRKELASQQADLEQQLANRTGLETQAATLRHQMTEIEQAAAALPHVETAAQNLDAQIQNGDFAHDIRQQGRAIEARLSELGYSPDAHTAARAKAQELAHWTDEKYQLEMADSRLQTNQRTVQAYTQALTNRAADIAALEPEETQFVTDLRELPTIRQRAHECASTAAEYSQRLEAARKDLYEKQSLYHRAQDAAEQLVSRRQERAELAERQDVFQELSEACSKKGVQAMLIETAIPEIEREANQLLNRITSNQMHLMFEMQRSTKAGSTVETLDIRIADALGTRTYDAFSGGEATRINFAIRIALSRLLAGRVGASLETLVIDEGMSALDADGRERFVEAITSVQHDFRRILVITHLDDLKDRFPARIEVTKTAEGSIWSLI
jgi:exonuclease SbcC